jgi:hypothetical protein
MAHGFVSYSKPKYGNLSGYIADKIKSAAGMAAEERKARDEEIKSLQQKEELTDEEQERLDFLTEQQGGRKGSFFGKALAAEFGGDRARRLKGTFSKDPSKENDPALSKGERFSALLDRPDAPAEEPVKPETPYTQLSLPGMETKEDGGNIKESLNKIFSTILKSYDTIADRVSAVGSAEKENVSKSDKRNNFLASISSGLASFKDYFSTDNKLKEKELDTEVKQLEFAIDQQENAEAAASESSLESGQDLSTTVGYEDPYAKREKQDGGGILGSIGNLLKNFLPKGGKAPGGGGGKFGALKNIVGSFGKGGMTPPKLSKGGVISSPENIKKLSEGGIVPSLKTKPEKTKMASGGIVDNPTVTNLNPGDSVIPLNRNNAMGKMFQSAGSSASRVMADPLAKVMQLPSQVGGGLMMGLLSQGMEKLGGIANFFKPAIMKIATPLAQMFGLPATIISSFFGGPAAAATMDFDPSKYMGKGGESTGPSGGTTPSPTPPPSGGADLGASMRAGETIQAQGETESGGFVQGGSGLGSEGGQNTTGGYATHYHLSPPSNDPNGWAQARAVAFTSAKMMLNRGSSIYFGNIKQFAVKGDDTKLQQQIAAEQQAHTAPGRTQGGIDMQEKSPTGNMALKFPLKVTNVTNDISGGSGRTARIIGTNVRLAHGAAGSANSVENAANPIAQTPPGPAGTPAQPNRPSAPQPPRIAGLTLPSAQPPQQQAAAPMGLNAAFGLTNPTGIYNNYYNGW